jgi:hypothetical protein
MRSQGSRGNLQKSEVWNYAAVILKILKLNVHILIHPSFKKYYFKMKKEMSYSKI